MTEKNMEKMDEIEFNLKDLCLYICLRWRMILIWMLIGALVLGGMGTLKSYSDVRAAKQALEMSKEETTQSEADMLEELKQELTDAEVAEVERIYGIYKNMLRNSENVANYNSESIRMKLNPYAVPTVSLSYYIDNHYQAVYPVVEAKDNTEAILSALSEEVTSTSTCEKILNGLEWEKDSVYVRELITTKNANGILTLTLIAPSQEECEVMRDIVMETINEQAKHFQNVFGTFDAVLVENEYSLSVNTALLSEQLTLGNNIYNLKSNYVSLVSGLLEYQKAYLNGLINAQLQDPEEDDMEISENQGNTSAEVPKPQLFQIKYIILGILAGAFLYCLWLVLKYVISNKLHTAAEMEQRYRIRVLAEINDTENKVNKKHNDFILDKFFYHIFLQGELRLNRTDAIRVIQSEIRILTGNIGIENIYVASTCDTPECRELQEWICAEGQGNTYTVYGGCNVSCNPRALEALGRSDGVVLIEQVNASSYDRIKRLVCFCEQNRIPILGCAIVQ